MADQGYTETVPIDPYRELVPEVFWTLEDGIPVYDTIPEPTPGDPDTAYSVPAEYPWGRRHQLMLCQGVTHDLIGELRSFRLDSWEDWLGAPGRISGTVSVYDPGWGAAGAYVTSKTIRGETRYQLDLKGLEVLLVENGIAVAAGIFHEPIQAAGPRFTLTAAGPESVFDERTLGETDQADFLQGRGSFPDTNLNGWTFQNCEYTWDTTNQWEGDRSLQVRRESTDIATAVVYSPWVNLPGQDGWVRHPVGSTMLRSTSAAEDVYVVTEVQLPGGTPVRPDFTLAEAGRGSEDETDWQGPITSRGWLTPYVIDHRVRVGVVLPADTSWVSIDYLRLQWPTLTGFVTQKDLSQYPPRIVRDAQYREGGSRWGISWTVRSLCNSTDRISWAHQDDHPVGEALASITERTDGPDIWITPGWNMEVAARRGRDRRDVSLTGNTMRDVRLSYDPGAEVDELRALTDLGSGPSRVLHAVNQPERTNPPRRRIRQIIQAPNGLRFDAGRAWTQAQAEFAARHKVFAEVDLTYGEGLGYGVGDGVLACLVDGDLFYEGPVRIMSRRFQPFRNRCTLSVGIDPTVAL